MRSIPIWVIWIALVVATFATLSPGCGGTAAAGTQAETTAKWDESHWDDATWAR